MQRVKGMVQVEGTTYRIVRIRPHVYEAVRILDNQVAGWFSAGAVRMLSPGAVDLRTLQQISRMAIQQGKTSWAAPLEAP